MCLSGCVLCGWFWRSKTLITLYPGNMSPSDPTCQAVLSSNAIGTKFQVCKK
jgi:hypothetical protein